MWAGILNSQVYLRNMLLLLERLAVRLVVKLMLHEATGHEFRWGKQREASCLLVKNLYETGWSYGHPISRLRPHENSETRFSTVELGLVRCLEFRNTLRHGRDVLRCVRIYISHGFFYILHRFHGIVLISALATVETLQPKYARRCKLIRANQKVASIPVRRSHHP